MIDTKKTPEGEVIMDFIERRIKKKLACNIIVTGELGKGKSYLGMRLLEKWYKRKFEEPFLSSHICESLEQAILIVKDFQRKGEGILIEELSVLAGSRESLTRMNRYWNKFMDTCRIKQAIIVGNTPFLNFIDKHIISLSQIWIETLGVNFKKKIIVCKPLIIQPSQRKIYFHKFVDDDGDEIGLCYFKKPNDELTIIYDKLKERSNLDLYDELAQRMLLEKKKQLKELGKKTLAPREQEAYNHWLNKTPPKEAYKKMGLKYVRIYYRYVADAKKKLITNKIGNNPKEIIKIRYKDRRNVF